MDTSGSSDAKKPRKKTSNIKSDKNTLDLAKVLFEIRTDGRLVSYFELNENQKDVDEETKKKLLCAFMTSFVDGQILSALMMAMTKYYASKGKEDECSELINRITKAIQEIHGMPGEDEPVVSPVEAFTFSRGNG